MRPTNQAGDYRTTLAVRRTNVIDHSRNLSNATTQRMTTQSRSCRVGTSMSVPILICECGLRVKAPGATPGRVGRCPKCGGTLRIPDRPRGESKLKHPRQSGGPGGYQLEPVKESSTLVPSRSRPGPDRSGLGTFVERKTTVPMADGFLPALTQPETNWFASILYPLRGAEGLGMIAATSAHSGCSPCSSPSIA